MEVRCRTCEKLFRVPDEKISGKGIKFACTRCGDTITVTKEKPENLNPAQAVAPGPVKAGPDQGAIEAPQSSGRLDAAAEKTAPLVASEDTKTADVRGPQEQPLSFIPPASSETVSPNKTAPIQTSKADQMEVRCGVCDKHFRVPHNKISGAGIKFACTRCGEIVRITKEEFDQYLLSQGTLFVLDLAEPKPQAENVTKTQEKAEMPPKDREPLIAPESPILSFTEPAKTFAEQQPVSFSTPVPVTEPDQVIERELTLQPEPIPEPKEEADFEPASGPSPVVLEDKPLAWPMPEDQPEPAQVPAPEIETAPVLDTETEHLPEEQTMSITEAREESIPDADLAEAPVVVAIEPPISAPVMQQEPARTVSLRETKHGEEITAFHSGGLLFIVVPILVCLIGYVMLSLLKPSTGTIRQSHELASIEGLLITGVTVTMEANGDILIIGTVENTADKEKTAWLVVVEVFDSQGSALNKIRLLNGKQLYTQRDYEILAKRGLNVQELKEKNLKEQGVVIAPKSSIPFEVRYVQPPVGAANFKATLQPFDPIRLFRELAEDAK